jgi:ATP-dependent DNA helicase PIF1
MLLYTVPGPTSYTDLRTYQNTIHLTFKAACAACGLLESDEEWDRCLSEAALIQTGHQFRRLFVTILVMNSPQDPLGLFNKFYLALSDDCRYRLQQRYESIMPTAVQVKDLLLQDLATLLDQAGKGLADYHLPSSTGSLDNLQIEPVCRTISEERQYDQDDLYQQWISGYDLANADQKCILDRISAAIDATANNDTTFSPSEALFFIDGPSGTGKTFVENLLLAYTRAHGNIAIAVASSGIASILLDGGRTSHSRFKIPIDIHDDSKCNISAQSDLAALIKLTHLII